jgi:hypothetical protein
MHRRLGVPLQMHGSAMQLLDACLLTELLLLKLAARRMQAAVVGSFDRIQNLASLMAALSKYRPSLAIALVDTIVEEVVSGLLHPAMHTPQASVAHARLLSELYNFSVIKTVHLFSILYLYITLGALFLMCSTLCCLILRSCIPALAQSTAVHSCSCLLARAQPQPKSATRCTTFT